ncbi:MAG TPA: hypothetical protein VF756_30050 [Thermoanaerobaculia bacterium]
MKPPPALAILLLLLGGLFAPLSIATAQLPPLVVEAPPALEPVASRVRSLDPERLASAMALVGLEEPGAPIRVILAPEGSPPARQAPPWVSGYAYPERSLIVLLPARTPSYPDSSLEDLLRHEVAHVLVARAAGGQPIPRWFHEGLAMIAGLSWGLDDRSRLTLALLADDQVSLNELEGLFRGGQGASNRAYAIAGAFVHDLFERHGSGVAADILRWVRRGLPFEAAFRIATGTSLAEAESSFWDRQSFWYRWVPLLTSSVTLWLLITMLALWAIRRRRARDVAQRAIWDEEERRIDEERRRVEEEDRGEWVN